MNNGLAALKLKVVINLYPRGVDGISNRCILLLLAGPRALDHRDLLNSSERCPVHEISGAHVLPDYPSLGPLAI